MRGGEMFARCNRWRSAIIPFIRLRSCRRCLRNAAYPPEELDGIAIGHGTGLLYGHADSGIGRQDACLGMGQAACRRFQPGGAGLRALTGRKKTRRTTAAEVSAPSEDLRISPAAASLSRSWTLRRGQVYTSSFAAIIDARALGGDYVRGWHRLMRDWVDGLHAAG